MREEERPLLDNWAEDVEDEDQKFLDQAEAKNADAQEQAHEEGLKEKTVLMVFQSKKDDWVASKMKDRKLEHRKAMRQKQEELDQKAVEEKIKRAKERKAEADKKLENEQRKEKEEMEEQE